MIVLCDLDGVLRDLVGAICLRLRNAGFDRTEEDFREYNLRRALALDELPILVRASHDASVAELAPWYKGAQDFVRSLQAAHDVYAVTAPWKAREWDYATRYWARTHFPPERVLSVAASSKALVRGDVLIEDNSETAKAWLDANTQGRAILIDRPWNREGRDYWPHPRMDRARSYDRALSLIDEYTK